MLGHEDPPQPQGYNENAHGPWPPTREHVEIKYTPSRRTCDYVLKTFSDGLPKEDFNNKVQSQVSSARRLASRLVWLLKVYAMPP